MILMTAFSAGAQKQAPPQGTAPKPFTVPAHETYALANGMKVTLVPYGKLPKVTVSAVVNAGNVNEPAELTGLADLMGTLMKEGTKTRSSKQVAEEFAGMGGSLDVNVGPDESDVATDVLSEFAPRAIALVADVTRNPLLPESELPRIKNDLIRQVSIQKSVAQSIALERFRKLLYGEHPYGTVFASEESVNKSTLADVRKFYEANFGAQRTHLYVAGRFDAQAVKKAIAASFGSWAKGPAAAPDVPQVKPNHTLDLTDRPGAAQSTLYMGLPVPNATSDDNIPLTVMNALLGGSFGSRITSNIREQKGYTYSPSSQISRRYHDAYWAEVADVTTAHTGDSLKEIFAEIERLQKEAPSEAELKGIENFLSGNFILQNSSRQALIGQLRFVNLQGLGDAWLSTYVQKVNAVTPKDVQRAAAEYIKPEQMTIVVVGDKAKVSEQLAPYMTGNSQTH
ncbi:MAG: insulinase family protein [Acidobacteria bacterium]|nr:insulinase family protein [Acidobacteriota bacterium]MBS1864653.1 insulinase family protein [Acidobacteriota bacterium]